MQLPSALYVQSAQPVTEFCSSKHLGCFFPGVKTAKLDNIYTHIRVLCVCMYINILSDGFNNPNICMNMLI